MSYNDDLQAWRDRWAALIHRQRTSTLHMSQPQLARYLGTAQSTVAMWESGRSVPSDLMKVRVLHLLEIDPREAFELLDPDRPDA